MSCFILTKSLLHFSGAFAMEWIVGFSTGAATTYQPRHKKNENKELLIHLQALINQRFQ